MPGEPRGRREHCRCRHDTGPGAPWVRPAPDQPVGDPAAGDVGDPQCQERDPRKLARPLERHPAHLDEVLRNPEHVEVKHRVDDKPHQRQRPDVVRRSKAVTGARASTAAGLAISGPARCLNPRVRTHHDATQTAPISPETTNGPRQPRYFASQTVSGGATTAPRLAPPMATPIAIARSRPGNVSATAFAAPGKQPPSPIPRRNRQAPSCQALRHGVQGTGDRPEPHRQRHALPRACQIHEAASQQEHHRVADQEGRVDVRVRGVRHPQPRRHLRGEDREYLPVEEAQPRGDEQPTAEPPAHAPGAATHFHCGQPAVPGSTATDDEPAAAGAQRQTRPHASHRSAPATPIQRPPAHGRYAPRR